MRCSLAGPPAATVFLDVAIGLALVGFVGTVGWARLIRSSGRRRPIRRRSGDDDDPGRAAAAAGAVLLVIAAWGVIVLPDALARQRAATKAGVGADARVRGRLARGPGHGLDRLLLIWVFCWRPGPVASHLLARAAVREGSGSSGRRGGVRLYGLGRNAWLKSRCSRRR